MLNLFDNWDEPTKSDEGTDPKSWAEKIELGKAIDALSLDVMGVVEVENRAILEDLNRHLGKPFAFVELLEGNDPRGIDCGILSRFPIDRAMSHRLRALDGGATFARDFPVFRVRPTPNSAIYVGVVHLKSKLGKAEESDAWRLAEAKGIRAIIDEIRADDPKTPFVIMGDFNDHRDAATLTPVFAVMKDQTLLVPEKDRYSFTYQGKGEQIDFLLTTPDFSAKKAGIPHMDDSPSDHCPIWAEFSWADQPQRVDVAAGASSKAPERPRVDATDLAAIEKNLLKEVVASGKVVKVFRPKSGGALLNFKEDHDNALVVFIPKDAEHRFGNLEELTGKSVTISGPVSRYQKSLQIRVTRPSQLEIKR